MIQIEWQGPWKVVSCCPIMWAHAGWRPHWSGNWWEAGMVVLVPGGPSPTLPVCQQNNITFKCNTTLLGNFSSNNKDFLFAHWDWVDNRCIVKWILFLFKVAQPQQQSLTDTKDNLQTAIMSGWCSLYLFEWWECVSVSVSGTCQDGSLTCHTWHLTSTDWFWFLVYFTIS